MIEKIRGGGWRQGSVFPTTAHSALTAYARCPIYATDCCIVLTQSCDIVFADFDLEPTVELVLARKLDSPTDGNFTHARSARRLHFHVETSGMELGYEAYIRDRFTAPRQLLADYAPDDKRGLSDSDYSDLIAWVVARYKRDAFPDAFNERIRATVEQKIKPALKKLPKIKALYLSLHTWDELPDKAVYQMQLVVTLNSEDFENISVRQPIEKGALQIATALNDCSGVVVEEATVLSEKDVSLDMLRYYGRWNFDYLSFKDPAKHVQPPSPAFGDKPRA